MIIDAKQYLTNFSVDEITEKNIIMCTDNENRKTLIIRNSESNDDYITFENEFFIMKNNINLVVDANKIGNFHVLICKKKDDISVNHFSRVCDYLFVKSGEKLCADEMLKLFYSLERIFAERGVRNRELEIGLYGELAVIHYLYDIGCSAYNKWHSDFFSKHDFELDKKVKVEVKTTVKDIRKHTFSHDQIYRSNLNVYVISCKMKPCEKGLSLYELCKKTIQLLTDKSQMLTIELLINKLGLTEEYQGVNFIIQEVYDNIKLFNAKDLPHIKSSIPDGVSNIHYDIDMSNITDCSFQELDMESSR